MEMLRTEQVTRPSLLVEKRRDGRVLIREERARDGCVFHIRQMEGGGMLAFHESDVRIATGDTVSSGSYCSLSAAQAGRSPHADRAYEEARNGQRISPRSRRRLRSSTPRCRNCGAAYPGDPCYNCDFSVSDPERDQD